MDSMRAYGVIWNLTLLFISYFPNANQSITVHRPLVRLAVLYVHDNMFRVTWIRNMVLIDFMATVRLIAGRRSFIAYGKGVMPLIS